MRTEPTFSILTTAYRTEAYVGETVESVLKQTRTDWEMIVVDNGMSDDMASIVRHYTTDPRIRLIRQVNRGIGGGVDAAAAAARGSYFSVLNSDDLLRPDFCQRMGEILAAEPDVDAIGCDACIFDEEANVLTGTHQASIGFPDAHPAGHYLTLTEALTGRIPYYTGAIRREAWRAVGGYQSDTTDIDESIMLWLRLLEAGYQVRTFPDRLCLFRRRADSQSHDPQLVEEFESRIERTYTLVARRSSSLEHREAVQCALRNVRYYQALRRARSSLLMGDTVAARSAAKVALHQRRTLRAALVVAALAVAPRMVRRIHPTKQRATAVVQRIAARTSDGQSTGSR
ncbi:glycosyltransferase family A protein [Rhodococcus sp. T2V]|nr:glycosyltransferase family A protein [Rhodococcus sp. T2V]